MTNYPSDLRLEDLLIGLQKSNYKVITRIKEKENKFYAMNTKDKEIYLVNIHSDNDKVDYLERCIRQYNINMEK